MNLLNRVLIEEKGLLGKEELAAIDRMPEKILQFGEGKFLRGFLDWMVCAANRQGVFEGRVVMVPPRRDHLIESINAQDGFYTMLSRGKVDGETVNRKEIVTSVSRAISPRMQWAELLACVEQPELKIVVSNTTEAGICYREEPYSGEQQCPETFPAKLTALLYHRFCHFNGQPGSGMLILPFELTENNGRLLQKIVLRHADNWSLPPAFTEWLEIENLFLNTLVDRIVTGVAEDEKEKLWREMGYRDHLLNAGEVFYQLFIEEVQGAEHLFPLHRANLNVKWVKDLGPYRTRKVRLLNGAHTATMPLALLQGLPTVRDAVTDEVTRQFMEHLLFGEVIPATANSGDQDPESLRKFAFNTLERFDNPFIDHYWQDISINSIAKFNTRVLPSFLDYVDQKGSLPTAMTFSLAALLVLYRGEKPVEEGMKFTGTHSRFYLQEDADVLEVFYREWSAAGTGYSSGELLKTAGNLLSASGLWGRDLSSISGLVEAVAGYLQTICREGMREALLKIGDQN